MIQMLFTKLGRKAKDRPLLPEGASTRDMAIGQLLGLASSAGFRFDLVDGRLVSISETANWALWPTLRACLDDIGADAVIEYFEKTTQERRRQLSASA